MSSHSGHKDYDRGKYVDRYSTYSGTNTPKKLVERTYKGSGTTYRMHGSDFSGSGVFGKKLGSKGNNHRH
ncbi:hypothetical protein C0389_04775 [bacterium]|nr:hypothetical protein [bacterium]